MCVRGDGVCERGWCACVRRDGVCEREDMVKGERCKYAVDESKQSHQVSQS